MPHVLLFRTATPSDTYAPLLASGGYTSQSITALEDDITHYELTPIVGAGAGPWEGVIITSRRAADAWVAAVTQVGNGSGSERDSQFVPWSALSVYSPGPAVGTVLASCPEEYRPRSVTAISAAMLAPIIVDTPPRDGGYKPYLMLVGDKTLPTLPTALGEAGRRVEKVKVYATRQASTLETEVASLAGDWAVLFSPSSSSFVLPHLASAGWDVGPSGNRKLKVAAIGETTAAYLRENGWRVDAVAETPDAPGVLAALTAADARD